jgi:hypothetical protein
MTVKVEMLNHMIHNKKAMILRRGFNYIKNKDGIRLKYVIGTQSRRKNAKRWQQWLWTINVNMYSQ